MSFLRNWVENARKSGEERQQEALNAYLDDALSPAERQRFERQLAGDEKLQAQLQELKLLKTQLRQLPRLSVPRSFTLDPAAYGRPQRRPLFQAGPALQLATVLTAFFFMLAIAADFFVAQDGALSTGGTAPEVALVAEQESADEEVQSAPGSERTEMAAEPMEVTRIVSESVAVEMEPAREEVETVVVAEEEAEPAEAVEEPAAMEEPMAEDAAAETSTQQADELSAAAESAGETAEGEALFQATSPPPSASPVTPSPSPAPTSEPAAAIAAPSASPTPTVSTPPRPAEDTDEQDRAIGALPSDAGEAAANGVGREEAATAEPEPTAVKSVGQPLSGLHILQIVLGALVIILAAITFVVRRRQF